MGRQHPWLPTTTTSGRRSLNAIALSRNLFNKTFQTLYENVGTFCIEGPSVIVFWVTTLGDGGRLMQ